MPDGYWPIAVIHLNLQMRKQSLIFFIPAAFALSGCPVKTYGLHRSTNPGPVVVGYDCVESSVKAISGVENLTYENSEGGRPLTWSGIKPADAVHHYEFDYHGERMHIWLTERWDGKVAYLGWAKTPDKSKATDLTERAKIVFAQIETEIQGCGYDNLSEIAHGDDL